MTVFHPPLWLFPTSPSLFFNLTLSLSSSVFLHLASFRLRSNPLRGPFSRVYCDWQMSRIPYTAKYGPRPGDTLRCGPRSTDVKAWGVRRQSVFFRRTHGVIEPEYVEMRRATLYESDHVMGAHDVGVHAGAGTTKEATGFNLRLLLFYVVSTIATRPPEKK